MHSRSIYFALVRGVSSGALDLEHVRGHRGHELRRTTAGRDPCGIRPTRANAPIEVPPRGTCRSLRGRAVRRCARGRDRDGERLQRLEQEQRARPRRARPRCRDVGEARLRRRGDPGGSGRHRHRRIHAHERRQRKLHDSRRRQRDARRHDRDSTHQLVLPESGHRLERDHGVGRRAHRPELRLVLHVDLRLRLRQRALHSDHDHTGRQHGRLGRRARRRRQQFVRRRRRDGS